MEDGLILLNKKVGETPLACLERFRLRKKIPQNIPLSYAGRLDPMAEGALLVLVGEKNKERQKYLNLDKEYIFEVLFNFSSDTFDILGLAKENRADSLELLGDKDLKSKKTYFKKENGMNHGVPKIFKSSGRFAQPDIENFWYPMVQKRLREFIGISQQKYPAYSSKTIKGVPLFELAKQGALKQKDIPEKEVEIYDLDLKKIFYLDKKDLMAKIFKKLKLVKGDFRQEKIIKQWQKVFKDSQKKKFLVAQIKVCCSSGTYVRSLAHNLGKKLKLGGLALSIKRTKIIFEHSWEKAYREDKFKITTLSPSILVEKYQNLLKAGDSVLDIGCGNGRNSIFCASLGCLVDSFDVADLQWLNNLPDGLKEKINFKKTDIVGFNYQRNYYKAIILTRVIQYLNKEELNFLFDKIYKSLKVDGFLLLSYNTKGGIFNKKEIGVSSYSYSVKEIERKLKLMFKNVFISLGASKSVNVNYSEKVETYDIFASGKK